MRAAASLVLLFGLACAIAPDPLRYRLTDTGDHWADGEGGSVLADARARYPEYFEVILDPSAAGDPDVSSVRRDLEHAPVDRRNYDALHAVAIGYSELNYRAERDRGGELYLRDSFRAAHLLAVPWRAYSEIEDPALRDAILDFFEDAASGEKLGSAATAPRLTRIVASLEKKEPNPARAARIRRLVASIDAP